MELTFYKYQGAGNDFVMVDNQQLSFDVENQSLVAHLCHRRFGIGADGLICINPGADDYHFEMVYFNADGALGSFCGNGARCAIKFAQFLGMLAPEGQFLAADGLHQYGFEASGWVRVSMLVKGEFSRFADDYFIDTGSPHYIIEVPNGKLASTDVVAIGKQIRYNNQLFPKGTNVNFIEVLGENHLSIRTYERGVEDETLACGTGITAAALLLAHRGSHSPIYVNAQGGNLMVSFIKENEGFKNVWLHGPANMVYKGLIEL